MHNRQRSFVFVALLTSLVFGISGLTSSVAGAKALPRTNRSALVVRNARVLGRMSASGAIASSPSRTTASDPSASASDARGDNGWGFDPRGDIVKYSAATNGTTITASLSTAWFDDPSTSYNWHAYQLGDPAWIGVTGIVFSLDVDNDYTPEYDVYYYWVPGHGVISNVTPFDQPSTILCLATPHWNAGSATYSSDMSASCVGRPASVRVTAYMYYETLSTVSEDQTLFTPPVSGGGTPPPPPPPPACPTHEGYWLLGGDGGIFSFGPNAHFYGSTGGMRLNKPVVGMTSAKDASGYWFVASDGGIFAFGRGAHFYGSTGSMHLNQPIVGMAARPQSDGYWLVARDGGIFSFGNAKFYGSTGSIRLNQPIVGMAPTPTGKGYWLVARDGGIFSFGDAKFYGSTGSIRLNQPIVGMSSMPNGHGYWFVARDGGIFTFGPNAHFHGSGAGANPIVGMHAGAFDGYRTVASDGSVFAFATPNCGGMNAHPLASPIVAIETAGSPL